ncbi:MAG: hypothetical protein QW584_03530 [Thermofilaceae archaeon]
MISPRDVASRRGNEEDRRVVELPPDVADVVDVLQLARSAAREKAVPSSIMLQVLLYGDTFKRIVTRVEVNYDEFEKKYASLFEKLSANRSVVEPTRRSYYDRFWVDVKTVDASKVQQTIDYLLEPLRSIGADMRLRGVPKFNWKFSEAVEAYVFQERIEGVSFYNRSSNSLTIYSRVRGRQVRQTLSDAFVDFYVLLRLEPTGGGVRVVYGCTCPHSRGETRDSRDRSIPASYTGMCKHVLATLFYFFPNVYAYALACRRGLSEKSYAEALSHVSDAYERFKSRLDEVVKGFPHDRQSPPEEETPLRVVYSNVAYLFIREFWESLEGRDGSEQPILREVKKLVPSVSHLYEFDYLWKSLSLRTVEVVEESGAPRSEVPTETLSTALARVEKIGTYERLYKVRRLLNGLQGSMEDTPYTRSIIAALILGSNLGTDPIIVSSYGDPGTGKTLTATGVGELVGFRSLVVERDVSTEDVLSEAKSMVSKRVERYMEFFEKVVLPRVPRERAEEASDFFRKSVEEIVTSITSDDLRDASKVAKRLAEAFASLYGVSSGRTVASLARLYLSLMKLARKLYLDHASGEAVKRKVLDERRVMLTKLQELGLISSADEKEKFNSGAVRWDIQQTTFGYRILVYVDLHYLYSKLGGDKERISKVLEELSRLGRIRYAQQKGGVAEVKLSEAPYLEKSLRTREEDISGRLIWVGGEMTRMGVILIDESRRAPEILERMLTDLSKAARDTRRTNVIITADNAEPLMEAESDPRLDAFHSRVNFEVSTPSSTVEATIEETLREINELDVSGKLPLVTFDELYLLNVLSDFVSVPERYVQIAYSIPLLMVYDFKVLRPEIVAASTDRGRSKDMPPLILLVPKGGFEPADVKGDYETPSWGAELPATRRMPERRFGHHVMRAMKALAIAEKKTVVDEETFIAAVSTVLPSRIVPVDVQNPYKYFDYKHRVLDAVVSKIREVIKVDQTATEKLVEVVGSMSQVPPDLLEKALEEMIENPVLVAVFCRFLEQMLVSKKSREFVEYSKTIPGLYKTLELLARYEKLPIKLS